MNRNQLNGGQPRLTMSQTLRQPHSAVNDYNYNRLSNRAGGPSHSQRMANVSRVMNTQQDNSLAPRRPVGSFLTRNVAPSIPPILGGGNWMSSIIYGGIAGGIISLISTKNDKNAQKIRGFGLIGSALLTGMVLKQPGQMTPHAPSILGSGIGFIIAANLLGMRVKYPSPLQEVLPSWAARAGSSK